MGLTLITKHESYRYPHDDVMVTETHSRHLIRRARRDAGLSQADATSSREDAPVTLT